MGRKFQTSTQTKQTLLDYGVIRNRDGVFGYHILTHVLKTGGKIKHFFKSMWYQFFFQYMYFKLTNYEVNIKPKWNADNQ